LTARSAAARSTSGSCSRLSGGIALDDAAGAHYVGTELHEVVSSLPGSGGYMVAADGERPLEVRRLALGGEDLPERV
jgi:hypothetical protein